MDVSIDWKQVMNGKLEMQVGYYEEVDALGYSADVIVWVPYSDSRSELEARAKVAAHEFLKRAVSAHSS